MSFFACAARDGRIAITHHVPAYMLVIVDHPHEQVLHDVLGSIAVRSGPTLYVPGVSEAPTDAAALDAILAFRRRAVHRLSETQP